MRVERPKNIKNTAARLLGYLKHSRLQVMAVIIALLASSASMLAGSYFLKPIINEYIVPGNLMGLAFALMRLGLIYLAGVSASYVQMRLNIQLAHRTINIIRSELFEKMQRLPLKYFDTHTHGELMSLYVNDIDNVQVMLEQSLAQLLISVLIFFGSIVMMIFLSPLLFLIAAAVISIMIFASATIGKKSRGFFRSQQRILGELNGYIEEIIGGLKEVKVFNHEEAAREAFYKINDNFRQTASNANFLAGIIMSIMVNLNNICYASVAVGGGILALRGLFDIGSLAAFLQYIRQIGQPVNQISNQINIILAAMAGAERIFMVDIKRIKKDSLRQALATVLQDTHLFTGTVLENIRYGNPGATDEDCMNAAKAVGAHSFIMRLPHKYHTVISKDGANLSQGQRQLIAIARAYVASPPVMILDEATSSIDTRTERLVERGMSVLMKERTVFVIAHRLSTVRNADVIMVVENGEIIERGNHEELLAQKGRYYQLYTGSRILE